MDWWLSQLSTSFERISLAWRVMMDSSVTQARQIVGEIISNIEKVIVGKRNAVELAVIAVISQGHLLKIGRASCRERVCQYV